LQDAYCDADWLGPPLPSYPVWRVRRGNRLSWEEPMNNGVAHMIILALVLSFRTAPALAGPSPAANSRPVVERADVDQVEPGILVIRGMNFGVKSAPVVLLSKVSLEVLSFSDEEIVVRLPIDAPRGRYRLQVLAHGTAPSPPLRKHPGPPVRHRTRGLSHRTWPATIWAGRRRTRLTARTAFGANHAVTSTAGTSRTRSSSGKNGPGQPRQSKRWSGPRVSTVA
jgi:hypothetical protein